MIPRTLLFGSLCVAVSLALLPVPPTDATPATVEPEAPERLVVFELFNRSESGG